MSLTTSESRDRRCIGREDFPFRHDFIKLLEKLGLKLFVLGYCLDNKIDRRETWDAVNRLEPCHCRLHPQLNPLFRDHAVDLLANRYLPCFCGGEVDISEVHLVAKALQLAQCHGPFGQRLEPQKSVRLSLLILRSERAMRPVLCTVFALSFRDSYDGLFLGCHLLLSGFRFFARSLLLTNWLIGHILADFEITDHFFEGDLRFHLNGQAGKHLLYLALNIELAQK